MELKPNQSALVLETDENGEVSIQVASPDEEGLSGALCNAIAQKLSDDEQFQAELMDIVDNQ